MTDQNSTNNAPQLSRSYRGHTITFSPSDLKFHVFGPEFEQYKDAYTTFGSFDEARAKIDSETAAAEKNRLRNFKFHEIVLDETGKKVTVTAIHRGTADINGVNGRHVYPNIKWVEAALRRVNEIEKSIAPIRINVSRGYGRIDAEDYLKKMDELAKEIQNKTAKANELQPAEVVVLNTEQNR